jgi:hypothetical protein
VGRYSLIAVFRFIIPSNSIELKRRRRCPTSRPEFPFR